MATAQNPLVYPAQDDESRVSQLGSDCLQTPVVLRIILGHLSTAQLLQVSLVNKLWNYEARSVLKERKSVIANLESSSPCQKLSAFASDLQQMNLVPFSGMNIALMEDVDDCERCQVSPVGASLDPTYGIILERIPWRCLIFSWGENLEQAKNCQAFLLAQRILEMFSGDLEEFTLRLGSRSENFAQEILQDWQFPRLKTVEFSAGIGAPCDDCTVLTKAFISRAPNLENFRERWWVNLKENVLEGSSAALITHTAVRPAHDEFSEGILPALLLTRLILEAEEEDFSLERFTRITPFLLENSKRTLTYVSMDAVFVLPLMCYRISLENVRELRLNMDYGHLERLQPRVLSFLKAFNFTRTFPILSHLEIETVEHYMSLEQMNEFIWQGNNASLLEEEPLPDRAANIKKLSLSKNVEDSAIPFLAQMLPNTQELWISRNEEEIPYGLIWEHLSSLKELVAHQIDQSFQNMGPPNLDSVFCGIFPQEVAQLRKEDDEYLKSVNIVPVMPAITCLRALQSLDIAISDQGYDSEVEDGAWPLGVPPPRGHDPTFLFSKVTGLIAFARVPGLSISMHSEFPRLEKAMSHLKPYAKVYLEDQFDDNDDDEDT